MWVNIQENGEKIILEFLIKMAHVYNGMIKTLFSKKTFILTHEINMMIWIGNVYL